jgi:hypothetical protein
LDCVKHFNNCKIKAEDHSSCETCDYGYYLEGIECYPIKTNCLTILKGMCTECKPEYQLKNGACEFTGAVNRRVKREWANNQKF